MFGSALKQTDFEEDRQRMRVKVQSQIEHAGLTPFHLESVKTKPIMLKEGSNIKNCKKFGDFMQVKPIESLKT